MQAFLSSPIYFQVLAIGVGVAFAIVGAAASLLVLTLARRGTESDFQRVLVATWGAIFFSTGAVLSLFQMNLPWP